MLCVYSVQGECLENLPQSLPFYLYLCFILLKIIFLFVYKDNAFRMFSRFFVKVVLLKGIEGTKVNAADNLNDIGYRGFFRGVMIAIVLMIDIWFVILWLCDNVIISVPLYCVLAVYLCFVIGFCYALKQGVDIKNADWSVVIGNIQKFVISPMYLMFFYLVINNAFVMYYGGMGVFSIIAWYLFLFIVLLKMRFCFVYSENAFRLACWGVVKCGLMEEKMMSENVLRQHVFCTNDDEIPWGLWLILVIIFVVLIILDILFLIMWLCDDVMIWVPLYCVLVAYFLLVIGFCYVLMKGIKSPEGKDGIKGVGSEEEENIEGKKNKDVGVISAVVIILDIFLLILWLCDDVIVSVPLYCVLFAYFLFVIGFCYVLIKGVKRGVTKGVKSEEEEEHIDIKDMDEDGKKNKDKSVSIFLFFSVSCMSLMFVYLIINNVCVIIIKGVGFARIFILILLFIIFAICYVIFVNIRKQGSIDDEDEE